MDIVFILDIINCFIIFKFKVPKLLRTLYYNSNFPLKGFKTENISTIHSYLQKVIILKKYLFKMIKIIKGIPIIFKNIKFLLYIIYNEGINPYY